MVFEKICFVESHWKGKTEAEFIAHESHHGLTVQQLKEAFKVMNPVKKNQPVDTGNAPKKEQ